MKENFKPEEYKEFKDDVAKRIKEIPKDEVVGGFGFDAKESKRKNYLSETQESIMYKYSNILHREENDFVDNLVESGEIENKQEAEQKWTEHVAERENLIKGWVENDLCDPGSMPEDLIENRPRVEMLESDIRENINKKIEVLIQNNPEVSALAESFKISPKEGTYNWYYVWNQKIPNSSFLEADGKSDISQEQREKVKELKGDEQKLGLFLKELLSKKGKELGLGSGWNDPTGHHASVTAKRNLESIMGGNTPYVTYGSDRYYQLLPFGKNPDISRSFSYPNQIDLLAAYGKEDGKKLINNLSGSYRLVLNLENDKKIDKNLVTSFGKDYMKVKNEFPELLEFARKLGKDGNIKDIDFKNKTAVFLGGRSEYGSSGGIGYFSKVIVFAEGEDQEKEFQYRDRYSASKDNWNYQFSDLKIKKVDEEGDKTKISISAIAGKGNSTNVDFQFEKKTKAVEQKEKLSLDEQMDFRNQIDDFIQNILSEKASKIKGNTHFDKMNGGYSSWNQPKLQELKIDAENGTAVFSVIENIGYGSPVEIDMPQNRCELYLAQYGKEIQEIARDHAYVVGVEHPSYERVKNVESYGDPTMQNIKIKADKITYSGRGGKKEYLIKE